MHIFKDPSSHSQQYLRNVKACWTQSYGFCPVWKSIKYLDLGIIHYFQIFQSLEVQFIVYTLWNFIIISLDNWQLSWSGPTRFADHTPFSLLLPVLPIQLFLYCCQFCRYNFFFIVARGYGMFKWYHIASPHLDSQSIASPSPRPVYKNKKTLKFNEHTSLLSHAVSDNRHEIIMVALEKPLRDHVECWHTSCPFPERLPDTISGTESGDLRGKKGTLLSHGQLHRFQFASITVRYCQGKSCHHDHVVCMAILCPPSTGEPQKWSQL